MAQKLTTEIILNLSGNLAAKARRYGTSMSEFAQRNEKSMALIRRSTLAAGRGIDRLGNRYVGFATAFATGATLRGVGNFEAQMTRIGTNAKLSEQQVEDLTHQIQEVSNQKGINIDTSQLASAVDTILGKTGDYQFTIDNLKNIGITLQATGGSAESTGKLMAQFREKGITAPKEVLKEMDRLFGQFAIGSVSVKDLADVSEQLFSTYQGKGPEAVTQMSALLQLFAKSKGDANQALTAIQGVFAALQNKQNVQFLSAQGINVFKKGTNQLREPVQLLLEILDKAKNDPLKLGDVFDQNSLQGLQSLFTKDRKELLLQMVNGTVDYGATLKAANRNANTFNSSMISMHNSFNKFANEQLADPIKDIADAINSVDDATIQHWLKWGEVAAGAIGGLIVAKKGLDIAASIKTIFGKNRLPGGGKNGSGPLNSLGATPVYVVNMPGSGFDNPTSPIDPTRPKTEPKGKLPRSRLKEAFSLKSIASMFTIGYGLYHAKDFPLIRIAHQPTQTIKLGGKNYQFKNPGLLDALDSLRSSETNRQTAAEQRATLRHRASQARQQVAEQARALMAQTTAGGGFMPFYPPMPNPNVSASPSPVNGQLHVQVDVDDRRVRTNVTSTTPSITVDPDAGQN